MAGEELQLSPEDDEWMDSSDHDHTGRAAAHAMIEVLEKLESGR
jgi:hypothetical protein